MYSEENEYTVTEEPSETGGETDVSEGIPQNAETAETEEKTTVSEVHIQGINTDTKEQSETKETEIQQIDYTQQLNIVITCNIAILTGVCFLIFYLVLDRIFRI